MCVGRDSREKPHADSIPFPNYVSLPVSSAERKSSQALRDVPIDRSKDRGAPSVLGQTRGAGINHWTHGLMKNGSFVSGYNFM